MSTIRLNKGEIQSYRYLMDLFAAEFEDKQSYSEHPPSEIYLNKLLGNENMIFLVEKRAGAVVGGLVAYVLNKFEKERSEVYIYDLAVQTAFRRQGIATQLINSLKSIAKQLGAWVIFVQADYGDEPAIKLYESLGRKEEVLHFDISV
ncbi:MAG: AAC(3)-I family aminoglycoside N-acetyltransferase [Oligoflexales bacterium]